MTGPVAFTGLGVMGAPMARCVAAGGHEIVVHDHSAIIRDLFRQEGFEVRDTAAEAAADAGIVIVMLPDSSIVRSVVLDSGVAGAMRPGGLVVDMSTGSPADLLSLGEALNAKSLRLIDVPVGRSCREAVNGTLLALAGGEASDLDEFRPVLDTMASDIVHVGPLSQGLRLKLVNNYMAMINHVLTAEVIAMAEDVGLDRKVTLDVLATTSAGLGQLNTNFPRKVLRGDVTPDFPIDMGIKDLSLALDLSETEGARAAFGELANTVFKSARDNGFGGYDCTGVLHYLQGQPAGDPARQSRAAPEPEAQ